MEVGAGACYRDRMNAIPKLPPEQQMTIEEFLAFCAERPDGERWELIEGVAIMNASPVQVHQLVVANIVAFLLAKKLESKADWTPLLGVGTRVPVSPNSLPQPDVYVQAGQILDSPTTNDAVVLFEVLSRSNTKTDQEWRRRVYASIPNCQHYVTVSLKRAEVVRYDRVDGWSGEKIAAIGGVLELLTLGVSVPLADIYRFTPLA